MPRFDPTEEIKREQDRKRARLTKKIIVLAAIFLPVLVIAGAVALNFSEIKKQYSAFRSADFVEKAREALKENRLTAARISLQNAYRHTPEKPEVLDLFIELLRKEGSQEVIGMLIQKYLNRPTSESTRELLQTAINTNQQAVVVPLLQDMLDRFANDPMIHRLVGIVFLGLQQFGEAEFNLQKAISLDPENILFRLDLATLQLVHPDPIKAGTARAFLEEIRNNPDYYLVATRSLAAHTSITNVAEGLRLYKEILVSNPEDWISRIRAFQILCRTDRLAASRELPVIWGYAKSVAEKSELLATVLAALGPSDAIEWSNKLNEDERAVPSINLIRINALWQQGRTLEALNLSTDGLSRATTSMERALLIVWAYRCQRALNQDTAATRSVESLRAIASEDQRAAIFISNQLIALGQEELGVSFLEIAAVGRDNALAQLALNALFNHFRNKADTAGLVRVHEAILLMQPENPFVQNNLAALLVLTNSNPSRAMMLAESAYFAQPKYPIIVSNYAHTIARAGRVSEAIRLFETISEEDFTNGMKLYRAHVLFLDGQKDKAAQLVEGIDSKEFLQEEIKMLNDILANRPTSQSIQEEVELVVETPIVE